MRRLLADSALRDSRRGFGIQPTWPASFPPLLIPLDHCLVSRDVHVVDRTVGPDVGSDHYPIVVELAVEQGGTPSRRSRSRPPVAVDRIGRRKIHFLSALAHGEPVR